jgi:hypothetical protein
LGFFVSRCLVSAVATPSTTFFDLRVFWFIDVRSNSRCLLKTAALRGKTPMRQRFKIVRENIAGTLSFNRREFSREDEN